MPRRELLLALDREREVVGGAAPDRALVEVGVLEAGDQRAGPPLLVAEDEVARGWSSSFTVCFTSRNPSTFR